MTAMSPRLQPLFEKTKMVCLAVSSTKRNTGLINSVGRML